jgi:hypothetical protein
MTSGGQVRAPGQKSFNWKKTRRGSFPAAPRNRARLSSASYCIICINPPGVPYLTPLRYCFGALLSR